MSTPQTRLQWSKLVALGASMTGKGHSKQHAKLASVTGQARAVPDGSPETRQQGEVIIADRESDHSYLSELANERHKLVLPNQHTRCVCLLARRRIVPLLASVTWEMDDGNGNVHEYIQQQQQLPAS